MPGDNFSRRVARAAAVGGGRTYRSQTPVVWYATLLAICLVGVALVGYSRYERLHGVAARVVAPTASDEWEAAVAVDVCGKIVPYALPVSTNAQTAYADIGNGLVDIEPQRSPDPKLFEGTHADLAAFLTSEGVVLTPTSLTYPGKPVASTTTSTSSTTSSTSSTTTTTAASTSTTTAKSTSKSKKHSTTSTSSPSTTTTTVAPTKPGPAITHKNGQDCGSRPATVKAETWSSPTAKSGTVVTSNIGAIPLKNQELITIAFVPGDTAILKPPAATVKKVSQFHIINPGGVAPSTTATTLPSVTVPTTATSTTSGASTAPSTSSGTSSSSSVTSST